MENNKCPVCHGRKVCGFCQGKGCVICDNTGKCNRCKGRGVRPQYNFEKSKRQQAAL